MSIRQKLDLSLKKFEKTFSTHNRIEVSKSSILHNFDLFSRITGKKVIPVLKSNAYGHGIELIVKILEERDAPFLAVDGYFEALKVREISKKPVLIMGAILPENFSKMKYENFAFVIQDKTTVRALGQTKRIINIHLDCNTGMNRYGASPDDIEEITKLILSYPNLRFEGFMSHLADSDGTDQSTVDSATAIFDKCVESLKSFGVNPTFIHIAQSAGSIKSKSKYSNTIRLGIGLYGINPFSKEHRLHNQLKDLRPALKLISTITKTTKLKRGDKVSYNYTFTAPKEMKIGVLPIGYYEGINRALSNAGSVKLFGVQSPIVGRICMNHTMIGIDGIEANVGDEVLIYSDDNSDPNSVDNISHEYKLFNYNILTSLSPDVRRVICD